MHAAPHDANVGAQVNADATVVLHDESGKTVQVPGADVEFWVGRGFRLEPFDPQAILDELALYLDELATSAKGYVDGVLNDGVIDTADEAQYAQAVHAMRLVEAAWHYQHRSGVGRALARRRRGQPGRVIGIADKAQQRLCRRFRKLAAEHKAPGKIAVAIARELAGFIWATLHPTARSAAEPWPPRDRCHRADRPSRPRRTVSTGCDCSEALAGNQTQKGIISSPVAMAPNAQASAVSPSL